MVNFDLNVFSRNNFSFSFILGGKVKKQSKGEFNFEAAVLKFQNLSYFDQHVVTSSCASSVIEMLSSFSSGSSNYLPVVEHVSFLLDLMEIALNIHGLIEFCIQVSQYLFAYQLLYCVLFYFNFVICGQNVLTCTLYFPVIKRAG